MTEYTWKFNEILLQIRKSDYFKFVQKVQRTQAQKILNIFVLNKMEKINKYC